MFAHVRYRISSKFIITTTVIMIVMFGALFLWISGRHKELIIQQVEKQALILYRQIVITRQWVSDNQSVLIPQRAADRQRNTSLTSQQILTGDGKTYTRITPASLTRQLSRLASGNRMYSFNITSGKKQNSGKKPDAFEQQALALFGKGRVAPIKRIELENGQHVFRYAAPLHVNKSCLACHREESFKVGGVGGCISVLIPFETAYRAIRRDRVFLFLTFAAMAVGSVVVLFLFTRRIIFNPIHHIRSLTARMRHEAFYNHDRLEGDELKEFAGLCQLMDKKLKSHHRELENKIAEATCDLSRTNRELEKANQELRSLNAARIDFFSEISHELRTPLTSIKGAADILARKGCCTEPVYVEIIKKNTDYLIRTIVDFLDYSRIEAGRLELDLQQADLTHLAAEVISARQPEAFRKKVKIKLQASGTCTARIDSHRIYQVISNLLANAIKFSPTSGEITVAIENHGRQVRISVKDQGPGIEPRYQQAVFDKFFQVPGRQAPDRLFKGSSGIGLAICRALVSAHGGKIWVESKPGAGSLFVFTVPQTPGDRKMVKNGNQHNCNKG